MKLYSYVVARDFGFAPNPFHGVCTLATCKPKIRQTAQVGDWVVGTGSKSYKKQDRLVFAMEVSETLTYDEYWADPRFRIKRPDLRGSVKQAFGDNIYHRSSKGKWIQENSHHSNSDGSANVGNVQHDTQTPRVLVGNNFLYWGGSGPVIPKRFRDPIDVCGVRGHKCNFPDDFAKKFAEWINSRDERGYVALPAELDK